MGRNGARLPAMLSLRQSSAASPMASTSARPAKRSAADIEYPYSDGKAMAESPRHVDAILYALATLRNRFATSSLVQVGANMKPVLPARRRREEAGAGPVRGAGPAGVAGDLLPGVGGGPSAGLRAGGVLAGERGAGPRREAGPVRVDRGDGVLAVQSGRGPGGRVAAGAAAGGQRAGGPGVSNRWSWRRTDRFAARCWIWMCGWTAGRAWSTCWRFRDPRTGEDLLTFHELEQARAEAERAKAEAETALVAEVSARRAAESEIARLKARIAEFNADHKTPGTDGSL